MERYRSGHNGTDSKSVDGQPSVGSNPTRSANKKNPANIVFAGFSRIGAGKSDPCPPQFRRDEERQGELHFMDFKTSFKKEKHFICLTIILAIIGCVYFINSMISFHVNFPLLFVIAMGCWLADFLIIKNHRTNAIKTDSLENVDEAELCKLFDRYAKRAVNWLLIAFLEGFGVILNMITLSVNSKVNEVLEVFSGNLFMLEILAFFLAKNFLIVKWLNKRHCFENNPVFLKSVKRILVISSTYWLLAGFLFYIFEEIFVLNISSAITGLFTIGIVIYNFTKINVFTYAKKKHNRIVLGTVLLITLVVGGYVYLSRDIWLTQPYINATPYLYNGHSEITYDETTGVFTITKQEDDFNILQLTDIHLGGGVLSYDKDLKALKAIYTLLEHTKPDLVIVTGDLTFPVGVSSFSFNNTAPVQQFAAFMRNTGIPWAFTYGNHDTESYAATSKYGLNELYKTISWNTSRTLLYPYLQPDITGRNNQLIELRNRDGSLNQAIFLIDSNAYTGEGLNKYDYIHDDQVAWYQEQIQRRNEEEGTTVSSLVFFHIPLQEYKTAYELYEQGSDEVKYYFGSNDETFVDKICCSEYPSKMFETARELGSTRGFFCGHDHYNNMSLEYQGIRLTYGMSIDYLAMPGIARDTKQRGATLIVVHDDSSIDIVQVPLSDLETAAKPESD